MVKRSHLGSIFPAILLCFLLNLVTACSTSPVVSSVRTAVPTPASSAHTVVPTPGNSSGSPAPQAPGQIDVACPAANAARAAVMPALTLGSNQNLVYIYNEVPQNTSTASGLLRRWDAFTGNKQDIVSSGIRIDQAQVSQDGQWILFLSVPDPRNDSQHSALLQLIRVDGQDLQTLYCFPNVTYSGQGNTTRLPISLQWSGDQKSILVSLNTNNDTSQIFLLDVASGNMRQLFLDQNDPDYYYSVVAWLDHTHFVVIKQGSSAPTPPAIVFLMDASSATVANPGLVNLLTTETRMSNFSMDSSPDGMQLYSSYCLLAASPFSTNISVGPATSGATRTMIYQGTPIDCVQVMRVVSANKLLMLVQVADAAGNTFTNEVWSMSLPGNSPQTLATLTTAPGDATRYNLNETSQFAWSNVSRDGRFYALQAADPAANTQSILIGFLTPSPPQVVALTTSGASTVSLVGWTTM